MNILRRLRLRSLKDVREIAAERLRLAEEREWADVLERLSKTAT